MENPAGAGGEPGTTGAGQPGGDSGMLGWAFNTLSKKVFSIIFLLKPIIMKF